jgi:hypothetical protein
MKRINSRKISLLVKLLCNQFQYCADLHFAVETESFRNYFETQISPTLIKEYNLLVADYKNQKWFR